MGMDGAGVYSLCVLEVVGDNKLRNSELLMCKQQKWLACTRLWVLPPSRVLTPVGQVCESSPAHPAAVRMFLGIQFWESVAGVLLGARYLSRGASPCTFLTSYHDDDARSDF